MGISVTILPVVVAKVVWDSQLDFCSLEYHKPSCHLGDTQLQRLCFLGEQILKSRTDRSVIKASAPSHSPLIETSEVLTEKALGLAGLAGG